MSTTIKIVLDTRRLKGKSKTFPIKLRVTHQRKPVYYNTVFDLAEEDFKKLKAPNISASLQEVREAINDVQSQATAFIKKLSPFSFFEFERDFIDGHPRFREKKMKTQDLPAPAAQHFDFSPFHMKFPILLEDHGQLGTISGVYCLVIKQLITENRLGSAFKYKDSYSSLMKFSGNVRFKDITVSFLRRYEDWMLKAGRSKTTVGILLRNLRFVFNEADHLGIINKQNCYPFGRRKYMIPTSKKSKKALSLEEVGKLYYHQPSCESEAYAKDLWFFCYFGNGMNIKDLAYLKYKNIDGEYLIFERAKTELTSRGNPQSITVFINEDMRRIIEQRGNTERNADNYIFPVLKSGMTALEEYFAVPRLTQFINDWMKRLAPQLGIEVKLSTIVTRHSFSTLLKRANVSTEYIQEALGHTDIRTTENYLGSFENDVVKANAGRLTDFKRLSFDSPE